MILFDFLRIPNQRVFSIVVSITALGLLWYFLTRTRLGWSLRAVSQDREAAGLQGINSNRVSMIAIGVGAAMAGLAGALMAPLTNINPHMGHNIIITAFIVTIVGGVGSLSGAVIASIFLCVVSYFHYHLFQWHYRHYLRPAHNGIDVDYPAFRHHGSAGKRIV